MREQLVLLDGMCDPTSAAREDKDRLAHAVGHVAPALVSGNAVVLKPAELTPVSAWHLTRALVDAGLPAGVLNLVLGKGSVVGTSLVEDPRVAGVSFTGSVSVGRAIHESVSARRARVHTFREQGSVAVDFYTWSKSVYMGVD